MTVRNTGARAAEEIVQLYIGDPVASRSRPLRELKGFRKIMLKPGEQQTVSFTIAAADLRFFRAERLAAPEPIFEPGTFIVQIGSSSQTLAAARHRMARGHMTGTGQAASTTRLSDDELLDLVQRQTLSYFWDFAHPASGMARERSNPVAGYDYLETVTTGGTGFGIMAMLAGAERGFLPRAQVLERLHADPRFSRTRRPLSRRLPAFPQRRHRRNHPFLRQRTTAAIWSKPRS